MLLSIGMIVKNEEIILEKCLKSLVPLLKAIDSELVIVDTGSTDNTIDIAKKYTEKVYFFDWINDFSAARNFGLSKCKGKWFIFIDADEILNDPQELISFFSSREADNYDYACYGIKNIVDEHDDSGSISYPIRIGKNKELLFSGEIHEHFVVKSDHIKKLTNTVFSHYGYVGELIDRKLERNNEYVENLLLNGEITARTIKYRLYYLLSKDNYEEIINTIDHYKQYIGYDYLNDSEIIQIGIIASIKLANEEMIFNYLNRLESMKENEVCLLYSYVLILQFMIQKKMNNYLIEIYQKLLNIYEKAKQQEEKYIHIYNFNKELSTPQFISGMCFAILEEMGAKDEILCTQLIDINYQYMYFNCWCMKQDIEIMNQNHNYRRINHIYSIIKGSYKEVDFWREILSLQSNVTLFNTFIDILDGEIKDSLIIKILKKEYVEENDLSHESLLVKSIYTLERIKECAPTKFFINKLHVDKYEDLINYMNELDTNYLNHITNYVDAVEDTNFLFMIEVYRDILVKHELSDSKYRLKLFLDFLCLLDKVYGENIEKVPTYYCFPLMCQKALTIARQNIEVSLKCVKEGLKYDCGYAKIIPDFLDYLLIVSKHD